MKTLNKLALALAMAATCLAAVADPVRTYERAGRNLDGLAYKVHFKLHDSDDGVGYYYVPPARSDDPCTKGFIKMTKSAEANAIIFTGENKLPTCASRRFVFRNGDMSAGYLQFAPAGSTHKSVSESLKEWDEQQIKASLVLLN